MELIQIHIFEPIWTKLCTHLPLGLEEVVGYVWTHNISTYFVGSECLFVRRRWLPAPESPAMRYIRDAVRVGVTSRTW